jgi:hypothetical protein
LLAVNVAAPVPPLATGSVPVTSDVRLTLPAVKADVPLPLTTPVSVVAPVPPLATGSVPVTLEASEMLDNVLSAPLMILFFSV